MKSTQLMRGNLLQKNLVEAAACSKMENMAKLGWEEGGQGKHTMGEGNMVDLQLEADSTQTEVGCRLNRKVAVEVVLAVAVKVGVGNLKRLWVVVDKDMGTRKAAVVKGIVFGPEVC
ncbi:hypothetical protein LguiA_014169 [Lonicera macranthoides]